MQVCLMVISNASQGNALKHKGKGKTALFAHGRVLAHPGGDQSIGRRRRERSPTLYLSIWRFTLTDVRKKNKLKKSGPQFSCQPF